MTTNPTTNMAGKELEILDVFNKAQLGNSNHKKYCRILQNICETVGNEKFVNLFTRCLLAAFLRTPPDRNADSIIVFASEFCIGIVTAHERGIEEKDADGLEINRLFTDLITEILKCVDMADSNIRFHSCQFLGTLFANLGPIITISDGLYDEIQCALLNRTTEEPKVQVRMEALRGLARLQNPANPNCPVIEGFINSLLDPSAKVRKVAVENIAPARSTLLHIVERLRDVDSTVKIATFGRLGKCSPKILSITYRQILLISGLLETSAPVRKAFEQVVLPKWLNAYDSDVIQFMLAIKLDANEDDIKQTEQIYEKVLPIIFKTMSLQELLDLLGLENDTKVVPVADITIEKVNYWYCLISYIKDLEGEEMVDDTIPSVVNLIECIDSFVAYKSDKILQRWENLEYQHILRKLFELLLQLDHGDEFGRQTMKQLIIRLLKNVKMTEALLNVVIRGLHSIISDVEQLAYELMPVINHLKDPLDMDEEPVLNETDQQLELTQLTLELRLLTEEKDRATKESQHDLVKKLSKDMEVLMKQVNALKKKPTETKERDTDIETTCRCLDLMISFLTTVPLVKLPTSVITFRDEFLSSQQLDVLCPNLYRRIFKISCLYAEVDKEFALGKLEFICNPLVNYRLSSNYDMKVLKVAVDAVSDLIRIYGSDIFETFDVQANTPKKKRKLFNKRMLYSVDEYSSDNNATSSFECATTGHLIDIMLSMLDDENSDLRSHVVVSLMKLVVRGLCVNSTLLARLLVKWFNPVLDTEDRRDQKIKRYIGEGLTKYIAEVENASTCLENAIIPTLCCIGNAPKTSPLAEVNYDDVVQCLVKFTKIRETTTSSIHKNLAYSILSRIIKTKEPAVQILVKMLVLMDPPRDEPNVIKELSQQIESAQENITSKLSLTYLKKYYKILNPNTVNDDDTQNATTNTLSTTSTTHTPTPRKDLSSKRRKNSKK